MLHKCFTCNDVLKPAKPLSVGVSGSLGPKSELSNCLALGKNATIRLWRRHDFFVRRRRKKVEKCRWLGCGNKMYASSVCFRSTDGRPRSQRELEVNIDPISQSAHTGMNIATVDCVQCFACRRWIIFIDATVFAATDVLIFSIICSDRRWVTACSVQSFLHEVAKLNRMSWKKIAKTALF